MRALIIDERDNVAVVIQPVERGNEVECGPDRETVVTVEALDDIPVYHKIAVYPVKKGEPIVKYGEHIGLAACDIAPGQHVHVHNVASHREEL